MFFLNVFFFLGVALLFTCIKMQPTGNLAITNATIVHSKSKTELEFLHNRTVLVKDGKIFKITDSSSIADLDRLLSETFQHEHVPVISLSKHQLLIPGFIDTHVHAPQFAFTGTGLDLPLLEWLRRYTFPCEKKFADLAHAYDVYSKSIKSHLRNGTTTICYFGTIHVDATKLLATLLSRVGMRAFVGKVCMDQNSPTDYVEASAEQSLKDTLEFINSFPKDSRGLVKPIVTPRFAISCSRDLMQGLGKLSKEHDLPIQTHLSENKDEINFVRELFPECTSYTAVYDSCQLLTHKTVLAHCVYLGEDEIQLIKERNCGVSHCPNSNITLHSGIMPTRKYLDMGIKLGLGTDVAGGYSVSILDAIRSCISSSKIKYVIEQQQDSAQSNPISSPLTLAEAFWLATCGGAEVLGLQESVGCLQEGMEFDALLIDYGNINCWISEDTCIEEIFEKIVYLMDDRHIRRVFVHGHQLDLH